MKKILIALAILASVQVANAQSNAGAAAKAVEAAKAAAANAKKATKVATWTKLAETYMAAYNLPSSKVWVGGNQQEVQLALAGEKAQSTETVTLNGSQYQKQVYADKNLYFNGNGQLEIIEVTKPVVDNALMEALAAYSKAYEVDTKATKTKDISAGIKAINDKLRDEAFTAYSLGNLKKAGEYFELAQKAAATAPLSQVDTNALYDAGFVAQALEDYPKAKNIFDECLKVGYYADNGEVYSRLADCVTKIDTSAAGRKLAKDYLEDGFTKFPASQSILIGLINYYLTSGENTDRLFELLDDAKKNEPNNASLYYVEGNIQSQLGNPEKAIAAYEKCNSVDPNYEYGYIGEGILYYNQAIDLQDKAQAELDDAKYMALVQEFETTLKKCIEPFEKAYEISKDENVKGSIAEYLKNTYYRFREQGDEYQKNYEKYAEILNKN